MIEYNVYCDESCHLPDGNDIMVLGGVWCPKSKTREINDRIREIKARHGISCEMKWTKLSASKKDVFMDLINYFFDDDDLHFRVLVVDNKDDMDCKAYNRTPDETYYVFYFEMLKNIIAPGNRYRVYLDIKDTRSKSKVKKLKEILNNNSYAFSQRTIETLQVVRSHEIEMMQITDILIGAVSYTCRGLANTDAKNELIELIKRRSTYELTHSTLPLETKFNIFHLRLRKKGEV